MNIVEPTMDVTKSSNLITLFKMYGVNFLLAVTVSLLLMIMGRLFGYSVFSGLAMIVIILMGQMYAITLFESWDGCYKKSV